MEHWLEVLGKEERKIRLCEEGLKEKKGSALDPHITALETTDKGLMSILDSQSHSHKTNISEFLKNQSIFNTLAGAISDYNRGLFRLEKRLNGDFVNAIMHMVGFTYSPVSLVVHYDGYIFDPKKRESWEDIKGMADGGSLAIYAHDKANFVLAKNAIDFMGGFIGNEVEIPFLIDYEKTETRYTGNPESQVEKLTCSDYKFDFRSPNSIKLTESLIDDIVSLVTLPNSNQLNRGIIDLLFENRRYNATDLSQMCLLNGKKVQKLNFVFKGGYVKDASYALFDHLTQVAANQPTSE